MVASIQPACLVYRVQMRPAFIHPRIDISGRLANLKASANRSRNHIRFNHARFNSVQQQTLPAAFVADIFGRYPLRLRKWPNSSLGSSSKTRSPAAMRPLRSSAASALAARSSIVLVTAPNAPRAVYTKEGALLTLAKASSSPELVADFFSEIPANRFLRAISLSPRRRG